MDYRSFFTNNDTVRGADFICSCFRKGGAAELSKRSRYSALFVLEGGLILRHGRDKYLLRTEQMAIVDRRYFDRAVYSKEAIVLEQALSEELAVRIANTPEASAGACTQPVPVTGRLETWVEKRLSPDKTTDDAWIGLLVKYQRRRLGAFRKPLETYAREKGLLTVRKI